MEVAYDIKIIPDNGHYTAYVNGELYCTGDTYLEVIRELTKDKIV